MEVHPSDFQLAELLVKSSYGAPFPEHLTFNEFARLAILCDQYRFDCLAVLVGRMDAMLATDNALVKSDDILDVLHLPHTLKRAPEFADLITKVFRALSKQLENLEASWAVGEKRALFLSLPLDAVEWLLDGDKSPLRVPNGCENTVLTALHSWVSVNVLSNKDAATAVLAHGVEVLAPLVRWPFLTRSFVQAAASTFRDSICANPEIMLVLLAEALSFRTQVSSPANTAVVNALATASAHQRCGPRSIYVPAPAAWYMRCSVSAQDLARSMLLAKDGQHGSVIWRSDALSFWKGCWLSVLYLARPDESLSWGLVAALERNEATLTTLQTAATDTGADSKQGPCIPGAMDMVLSATMTLGKGSAAPISIPMSGVMHGGQLLVSDKWPAHLNAAAAGEALAVNGMVEVEVSINGFD